MMQIIELQRLYLEKATHGVLICDGQVVCLTLELPWIGNQRQISCIPEGVYPLVNRYSDRFKNHLEVLNVPTRNLILFHPANNAQRELKGCIAPVSEFRHEGWGSGSRKAFSMLLAKLKPLLEKGKVQLIVKSADEEFVRYIKNENV